MRLPESRARWHRPDRILITLILMLALIACGAPAETGSPTATNLALPTPKTPTPTPTPAAAGAPVETAEPETDRCPQETTIFELAANHAFWTDTGMGKWNWEAVGTIPLVVNGDGTVGAGSQGLIQGRQYGVFSSGRNTCQFEAPAEVQISASGVCENSVLKLDVTESWQMGTYNWTCDDDSFQASVPPLGAATHPGLVFPLQGEGAYTVDVPWGGGGGAKSYTLYPALEPVPLVTP
jgi:hypothetical protein